MFKRFITIFVVAPIVFLFILYDVPPYGIIPFLMLMVAVAILATNEYFSITSYKKGNPYEIMGYVLVLAFVVSTYMKETMVFWNSKLSLLISILLVFGFITEVFLKKVIGCKNNFFVVIRGILYIGWFYSYFVLLRGLDHGFAYLIYLVLTIASCDTMAYIVGIKFGKHKIAPFISPKKSVEGCIAGFISAVIASYFLGAHYLGLNHAIIMGMIVGVFGQLGDLFESLIKRKYEVKDSGWILPGHGGILDRLDSASFIAPLIYYYLTMVILR
ncbi:MAG: hypothetical protein DKM50_13080 [Candidatus Margulisiibacteriota bacterium]|nr:MAG: hypothetical protein A2X43_13765 [Candidatus Margulisbacteria bacterium GWD2_39_127]OGI05555.1 MAG: hypothetical protein A2X42_00685 [Candidatus Margulisbacteria bacterium GWF2_38_17]OGI08363.1 MAG: hypothetical protein A2X41_10655 [Candidatus Margulisbacteria bacterium GWE2_39_32]PZM77334.1 MAG: hypothetical protein DKM50_13080 [Candidatus Margulisiibacteriota bacterium]HAR63156.1 hypothetical protein [Candidatus Margulisiibacteriota bacterium]